MLSNGPGDPAENTEIIAELNKLYDSDHPHLRRVPGPPAAGPGHRRQDRPAGLRPPGRQPPRPGPGEGPGVHHQPEPRLYGPRRHGGPCRGRGIPHQRQRRHLRGPEATSAPTALPPSSIPRPTPAPRIRNTCSTALSTPWEVPSNAEVYRYQEGPGAGLRPHRHRPGRRVRLRRHPGLPRPEGGGPGGGAGQLQPRHHHDGQGHRRPRLYRAHEPALRHSDH